MKRTGFEAKEFVCVCLCAREMEMKPISSYLLLHNFQYSTAHLKYVTSKILLNWIELAYISLNLCYAELQTGDSFASLTFHTSKPVSDQLFQTGITTCVTSEFRSAVKFGSEVQFFYISKGRILWYNWLLPDRAAKRPPNLIPTHLSLLSLALILFQH